MEQDRPEAPQKCAIGLAALIALRLGLSYIERLVILRIFRALTKTCVVALTGKAMKRSAGPYFVPASSRARAMGIALALLAAAAALSACKSTLGTKAQYADDQPAGELYNKGLAYMNAGKLQDAVKNFDEVDRQHPFSEDARKALIMSAFASYRRGEDDDTIQTSTRYPTL